MLNKFSLYSKVLHLSTESSFLLQMNYPLSKANGIAVAIFQTSKSNIFIWLNHLIYTTSLI